MTSFACVTTRPSAAPSYAHLARLAQAHLHAVWRVGARQIVDFTPGRPFVQPSVRRTPAVKGVPRSRWLTALGHDDQLVAWLKPQTCPSWLAKETLAALPEVLMLREVRYQIGTPGFRTREITLITTLLDAETYGVVISVISRVRKPAVPRRYRTSRSTNESGRAAKASRLSQEGQVVGFNHATTWSWPPRALSHRDRGMPLTAGVRRTLGVTNGRPGVKSTIWRAPTPSTACTPCWARRARCA